MKKYLVRFITTDGDYSTEWCHASSPQEAESTIMGEHWNIERITSVEEI